MAESPYPIASGYLQAMWSSIDGDPAWLERVSFTGEEVLPSCFAFTDMLAASVASASTAMAELATLAGAPVPDINVDRVLAAGWVNGASRRLDPAPPGTGAWTSISTEYPTKDDRFLRLVANYPHLRDAALGVLGVPAEKEAIAAVIKAHDADELEQAIIDAGGTAGASRSLEEWAVHPQGIAVAAEPLADVTLTTKAETSWTPYRQRPLAGVRVLDLTRIIAGPMGTRFLAGYGAEVLRIDPPGYEEVGGTSGGDLILGKRCACLDLKSDEGRKIFLELLSTADVFVHGYRPGALDGLGLGPEVRASTRPGLVEVTHNAYGWTGPWSGRRGFDSTIQMSTGISHETMRWAESDKPVIGLEHAQVLDHVTGYLIASAAIRGLVRRLESGVGSVSRLALTRVAALFVKQRQDQEIPKITLPVPGPLDERIYATHSGVVQRLRWPVSVTGVPFGWERPGDPYGTVAPVWSNRTPH